MIKINLYNILLIFHYHLNPIYKHEFSPLTKIQTSGRRDLIRTACTQYYSTALCSVCMVYIFSAHEFD
jgi:hypothetical protein